MRLGLSLSLLLVGCQHAAPEPEQVLKAYQAALLVGDVQRVWALSARSFQKKHSVETLSATEADELQAAGRALKKVRSKRRMVEYEFEGGPQIRLVEEAGAWKVAQGAWQPEPSARLLALLEQFFQLAEDQHLAGIRAFMTAEAQRRFASDAALSAHLQGQRERMASARTLISNSSDLRPEIRDKLATLRYAPGREVLFQLEDGRWRIIDLE